MAGAYNIGILVNLFKGAYEIVSGKAEKKNESRIAAHGALNKAFIATYDYLNNQNGTNIPQPHLADLWNEAATAVMKIDMSFGEMLYNKSRFWLDPQLYINLGREDDIIELRDIVDEMERLRMKIK